MNSRLDPVVADTRAYYARLEEMDRENTSRERRIDNEVARIRADVNCDRENTIAIVAEWMEGGDYRELASLIELGSRDELFRVMEQRYLAAVRAMAEATV